MEKQTQITRHSFTATAKLLVEHNSIVNKTIPIETKIHLEPSEGLIADAYLSEESIVTAAGCKVLINAFCQGLIGTLHIAHENGFLDSAQTLRYILDTITNGFAEVPSLEKSTLTED